MRASVNYAVAAIALDRLRAVTNPYAYRNNVSKYFPLMSIAFFWSISSIFGFLSLVWMNNSVICSFEKIEQKFILIFGVLGQILPHVIVLSCYGIIFMAIKQVREIYLNFLLGKNFIF
jgi:hypothetical protein